MSRNSLVLSSGGGTKVPLECGLDIATHFQRITVERDMTSQWRKLADASLTKGSVLNKQS